MKTGVPLHLIWQLDSHPKGLRIPRKEKKAYRKHRITIQGATWANCIPLTPFRD